MTRLKRSLEKEEFWRLVIDEHATSGLPIRAFCQREGVAEASFYFWRKELARRDAEQPSPVTSPAFVPVNVIQTALRDHGDQDQVTGGGTPVFGDQPSIEVTVPGGIVMRAPAAIDADHVTAWIAAILKASAS